jgi:hypothetical protein
MVMLPNRSDFMNELLACLTDYPIRRFGNQITVKGEMDALDVIVTDPFVLFYMDGVDGNTMTFSMDMSLHGKTGVLQLTLCVLHDVCQGNSQVVRDYFRSIL